MAPVQALMSGTLALQMKEIDYFISSKLMEMEDSQNHYTERLTNSICINKMVVIKENDLKAVHSTKIRI